MFGWRASACDPTTTAPQRSVDRYAMTHVSCRSRRPGPRLYAWSPTDGVLRWHLHREHRDVLGRRTDSCKVTAKAPESTASTSATEPTWQPASETSTTTARSDRVRRSINCDISMTAGDLDLVVGENMASSSTSRTPGRSGAGVRAKDRKREPPSTASTSAMSSAPALGDIDGDGETVSRSRDVRWAIAGDLDLVVGEARAISRTPGRLRRRCSWQRTGSANPFDGIDVGDWTAPTLGDLDNDGTLPAQTGVRRSLTARFVSPAGDLDLVVGSLTPTSRTPGRLRRRHSCNGTGSANPFDGIDVGDVQRPRARRSRQRRHAQPRPSIDKLRPHTCRSDLDLVVGERKWLAHLHREHRVYGAGDESC